MDLFLVRHAPAEVRDETAEHPEEARPLTREGRHKLRRARGGMKRLEWRFDRLLHSPLLRAVETADLLMSLVDGPALVEPLLAQSPDEGLLARLEGERLALVGHQPWLGELLAWLTVGDRAFGAAFDVKKAGVAHLTGDPRPGGMRLVGLLPASVLRQVGR